MKLTLEEKLWRLENDPAWCTVFLPVEDGSLVGEEVLVERLNDNHVRVAASPGMVEGLAADDIIVVDTLRPTGYLLISRGRNVCVHLFREQQDAAELRHLLEPLVEAIGGWLDGTMGASGLCFTIPVAAGFPAIEQVFRSVVGNEWYFSNVYDLTTNEPLNWWL